jgi:WG containing repeat
MKSVSVIVIVAIVTSLSIGSVFPQPVPPGPPSIAKDSGGDGNAAPQLSPTLRRTLEAELKRDERAKKIGVHPPSFPLTVCFAGRCGALNRDGTYAVPLKHNWMDRFFEGRAIVQAREGKATLYGYVDEAGRVVWRPQFATAGRFSRGLAQIDFDGASGLVDRDGKVVLWPRFGFVVPFTKDLFWVTEEREVVQGNTGRTQFLHTQPISVMNGMSDTAIRPKGRWGLVDRKGDWVRQPEFLAVGLFGPDDLGLMWAKTDAGWGLIRTDLSWQVEPQFDQAGQLSENRAVVVSQRRWGFVDESGRVVIEQRFDYAFPFSGRYAPVRVNKRFGVIDRFGAWVVEPTYDMIYQGGFLIPRSWSSVKLDDKYGLLDDSLRMVISPQLDQTAALCMDGQIMGVIDKKWRLFSRDGVLIPDEGARCDSMITDSGK